MMISLYRLTVKERYGDSDQKKQKNNKGKLKNDE